MTGAASERPVEPDAAMSELHRGIRSTSTGRSLAAFRRAAVGVLMAAFLLGAAAFFATHGITIPSTASPDSLAAS